MKQTAVEWLIEQLFTYGLIDKNIHRNNVIFHQAKEKFEQQIIDAYETSHISMMTAEQYYRETYESKTNL